jgi:hypothetical protein
MKLYQYLEKILLKESEEKNAIVYDDEKLKQRFEKLKRRFESLKKKEINYIKTSYETEKSEIERIKDEFKLTDDQIEEIKKQFEQNEIVDLGDNIKILNSDYDEINKNDFDQVLELVKKYKKNIDRLLTQFEEGEIEAPVILIKKGKNAELIDANAKKENPYLIGGNTRLMLLKALGMKPKVLEIKI